MVWASLGQDKQKRLLHGQQPKNRLGAQEGDYFDFHQRVFG
jgi:hypothetical protein